MIDPRDAILQRHSPLVIVGRHGDSGFEALGKNRHRYLACSDGLWLELRRPWLYLAQPIAPSEISLPYGDWMPEMRFAWMRSELTGVLMQFTAHARAALPNEHGGFGIFDERFGSLVYRGAVIDDATPGSLSYRRPVLKDYEHLAVDLHSHGRGPAGFSIVDDEDDAGEVKLAIVAGNLHERDPSYAVRLCALGLFLDVPA